ncbi:MAG TPA: serine protease [Planctomycetaceae bacterium]|nr:serine protease [Planctomycetaceae bacterium]HRF00997.1 S46 family peptidase [Pirellulaceae bacterium]
MRIDLRRWSRMGLALVALLVGTTSPRASSADEGMWLFSNLPRAYLARTYGFEPTDEWVQHLMLSSVRFNSGGSGSFVSSDGLVLTNHHVASDTIFKISTEENDYLEEGFLAKTLADEIPAPDLELNQLVSIEDVTDRVMASVASSMTADDAAKARNAVMAEIENESLEATGLRSDIVTLYGGAKYHLYRYKKYVDVRVVFAPEAAIAFFGGDADNFEYPRYCLDICLLRVYENGKPAKIDHFLSWNDSPPTEEQLVFVSGHPGRTQRGFTVDAMKYLRDTRLPFALDLLRRREIMLQQFGLQGEEQKRRAQDDLFGVQNSRKAYTGMLQGLQDPAVLEAKRSREARILASIADRPDAEEIREAFAAVAELQLRRKELIRAVGGFRTGIYGIAETLVLMGAEDAKPSADRLREFRDSNRESLEQELFSTAPLYPDLEATKLADEIARLIEWIGADDPLVVDLLEGLGPQNRAAKAIAETKLFDVQARRELAAGGPDAIAASDDPLIVMARKMQPLYRKIRSEIEQVEELERQAYVKVSEATVAFEGTSTYPDATFTLRLAFGPIRGYEEGGTKIAPWTTMGDAFAHQENHGSREPWQLPQSWIAARDRIGADVPFNFVCTADIIGGNSGSPVVNRDGEFVGIIFDGNIQSLTADYLYTETQGRAVSVHAAAIREALRKIYGAEELADSLGR